MILFGGVPCPVCVLSTCKLLVTMLVDDVLVLGPVCFLLGLHAPGLECSASPLYAIRSSSSLSYKKSIFKKYMCLVCMGQKPIIYRVENCVCFSNQNLYYYQDFQYIDF